MSWPLSHLFHPKSTWSPSIPGFLIHLRIYWAINGGQICTTSLFAFSKKKHHWMEYYNCFLWFDWRNFQYFTNDSYFLQWKWLEFIYWEPYQIRGWTSLHSIWHCIHSSALCFLQTKSSFKNGYISLNLHFFLNNKLIKGIIQMEQKLFNPKTHRLLRGFFQRNEVCLIKFSFKWRSKYFIWKLRSSANF